MKKTLQMKIFFLNIVFWVSVQHLMGNSDMIKM